MIDGKSVLALITARGESKGIPNKNIKVLGKKPLIQWTIDAALSSFYLDRIVVSSDSPAILKISEQLGCEPLLRPDHLAEDHSTSVDVILHALENIKSKYDYLILLQPTSPFRRTKDIDGIIESTVKSGSEVMASVARLKTHPMFIYEIIDGKLRSFKPQKQQLRRQDMPPVYVHNGALYIAKISTLLREKSFNLPNTQAYVTEGDINVDIDTPDDWSYAEFLAGRE
jgi:CMP-N,N'-diacetyllegionaminic acid synthase